MSRNWDFAAKLLWPHLVDAAEARRLLFYSDLAPIISTNDLSVGHALGPIQDYCLRMRIPPLTAVVVGKRTGVPGPGFIAWDVDDVLNAQEQVQSYPWRRIRNPFAGLDATQTLQSFARELAADPARAEDIYRQVPDRGLAQVIFREAVGEAYNWHCAFCGLTFEEALDAAHIRPWSKAAPELRLSITNGILLCATHHRLFDKKFFQVSNKYRIVYCDPKASDGPYQPCDRALTIDLHDQEMHLPVSEALWPRLDLIAEHAKEDD